MTRHHVGRILSGDMALLLFHSNCNGIQLAMCREKLKMKTMHTVLRYGLTPLYLNKEVGGIACNCQIVYT